MDENAEQPSEQQSWIWACVPCGIALALVSAIWLRYTDPWAESDTVALTRAARGVLNEGVISPKQGAYDHGFAFPSLLASLSAITGISVKNVQVSVLPWLTVATALMAFSAFRAISGRNTVGAIAASLLLVQPDFLFVSQRGSHEKMTWTLVLTLLFLLVTSLQSRRLRQVAPSVVAFYLCGFALITTNAFFGSSFTTVILISLTGSIVVARRFLTVSASRRVLPRLSYVFAVLTALTYVVLFYVYSPAENNLANLSRIADRLAALYLNVDTKIESHVTASANVASNAPVSRSASVSSPYAAISLGWTSLKVFFALTAFTWTMMISAAFSWLVLAVTFVRRGVTRTEVPLFLIWMFAAASGLQIVLSVATDYAGALGSNMQLRLFPVFTVFAIPLSVTTFTRYRIPKRSGIIRYATIGFVGIVLVMGPVLYPAFTLVIGMGAIATTVILLNWQRSSRIRLAVRCAGMLLFTAFSAAAVLKATNDPLVSNKWTFYSEGEAGAIRWGNKNLSHYQIWGDIDERLNAAGTLELADAGGSQAFWTRTSNSSVRFLLISDVISSRAVRTKAILPGSESDDRIYDDGSAQIVHRVPTTPYQP